LPRKERYRRKIGRGSGKGYLLRLLLMGIAALVILFALLRQVKQLGGGESFIPVEERFFLPASKGQLIHHHAYSLSYVEQYEQPEWVAYVLTKENLRKPNVPRTNWFAPDPMVTTGSARFSDYKHSGYTKGHLAPAGDMAQDTMTMRESFYMSNMSPQLRAFNGGIWRELEENVRDWAYRRGQLYVVTGPVLGGKSLKTIGRNKVAVPRYFYKVLLDLAVDPPEAMGFLIEHNRSELPLAHYEVTVDSVEAITGIDFFPELMTDSLEEKTESIIAPDKWPIDPRRFRQRVNEWNKN